MATQRPSTSPVFLDDGRGGWFDAGLCRSSGGVSCLSGSEMVVAKGKMNREYVWLQCTETGDLNYRTQVNVKGGLPEKLKAGLKKYSPRLRKHTLHKIKRK